MATPDIPGTNAKFLAARASLRGSMKDLEADGSLYSAYLLACALDMLYQVVAPPEQI